MTFDCWGLENTTAHSPYELKTDSKWKAITVYTTLTDAILSGPCSLVFYTSSSAGTYYVGDVLLHLIQILNCLLIGLRKTILLVQF